MVGRCTQVKIMEDRISFSFDDGTGCCEVTYWTIGEPDGNPNLTRLCS